MKVIPGTLLLFILQIVRGTPFATPEYVPEGTECVVQDRRFGINLHGSCQFFRSCIDDEHLSLKLDACSEDNFRQCCYTQTVPCSDATGQYSGSFCQNVKRTCFGGKFISLPDICPGDPRDIQCCVVQRTQKLRSGPASSTFNELKIPGFNPLHLNNFVIPDPLLWDPQVQTDIDTFRLQNQQSEVPSSDVRASQSLEIVSEEESLSPEDFPNEQAVTPLWAESDFGLDAAFDSIPNEQGDASISIVDSPFTQSSGYQEDAQLAADIFEGDDNLVSPVPPVSWVEG